MLLLLLLLLWMLREWRGSRNSEKAKQKRAGKNWTEENADKMTDKSTNKHQFG